jgi:hypothetical protein
MSKPVQLRVRQRAACSECEAIMSLSVLRRMSLLPTAKLTSPPLLDRSWHLFGGKSSSSVPDGKVRVAESRSLLSQHTGEAVGGSRESAAPVRVLQPFPEAVTQDNKRANLGGNTARPPPTRFGTSRGGVAGGGCGWFCRLG